MTLGINKVRSKWNFFRQRRKHGFDDSDLWNLDVTIAKFLAPRLKRYKEITCGYPSRFVDLDKEMTPEAWDNILDQMIWSFEFMGSDDYYSFTDKETHKRLERGIKLFQAYFKDLWD